MLRRTNVNRANLLASHVRSLGYYTAGIQERYSAIALLEFNHMRSLRNNETPFLVGLGIEPENPWTTGPHRRKLRGKSGLVTLELCAGAGGQAIGLERAGIDHLGLLEIDSLACSTLRQNRPKWNVIEQDLDTFDAAAFAGADIVSAGLPCPPFSVAGKQLGTSDERNLFPAMVRVVDQVRPRAVMVENVRGILDAVFEDYREHVSRQLRRLGYQPGWHMMSASEFGVPQLRPRVVFVAVRKEYSEYFSWPKRSENPATHRRRCAVRPHGCGRMEGRESMAFGSG